MTIAVAGLCLAQATSRGDIVLLDQNWSYPERLQYHYTSQGSAAGDYDVFTALEQANAPELFRADDNLARYGFIPQAADPTYNPDGLPISLAKTVVDEGRWKGQWAGLTCAACNNGQLEYQGARIRIAGGDNASLDFPPS